MALDLEENARRAGGHRWWEGALFEVLGGWVASTPELPVKLLLDRHSQHHGWRAAQWWDRLPVLAGVDRDALVAAPSDGAAHLREALQGLPDTVARLAGAYRVAVPRLLAAYAAHRAEADGLADGPTARTLDLVRSDLEADWLAGERALQGLLRAPADARRAADVVASLEGALLQEPVS